MFFEGSEKKVELVLSSSAKSLRTLPREFWHELTTVSGAQILSVLSSDACDAYLLSESSLFVWNDRWTMITCGRTTLINAVEKFCAKFGTDEIETFFYERKNEYFPHHQQSDFFEDVRRLQPLLPGKCFRFGDADTHHLFLYQSIKPYTPSLTDRTLEVLMYDLQGEPQQLFRRTGSPRELLRKHCDFSDLLPGFKIDDFAFEPFGYSMNALQGELYYTIHVTPQELGSYVSFETNMPDRDLYPLLIQKALNLFSPRSFDVVCFDPRQEFIYQAPQYMKESLIEDCLPCGYWVSFCHFYQPQESVRRPFPLEL